tara:strand:+ start:1633 stop:2556 length:924 start_codon:yes stop_codon:yes gene_type:complete
MIKQIISLIITICVAVYLVIYTEIFEFELSSTQAQAFYNMLYLYLGAASYCFIAGELTKNYSQVDRLWSTIPIVYCWYFTYSSGMDERLILMSSLVTIWGLRLSFNFARKGGFTLLPWKGEEDYRWEVLQKDVPSLRSKLNWSLFNFFFICFYQMGLIFLFSLPILAAWQGEKEFSNSDLLIAGIMLLLIITQTISDEQQHKYQTKKYKLIKQNQKITGDYKKGFIDTGLWKFSRHPNYTCEQLIWITFYFFSVSANGKLLNWSIIGCILLVILFYFSAKFSEGISSKKYPEYKNYQKKTPMFIGFK